MMFATMQQKRLVDTCLDDPAAYARLTAKLKQFCDRHKNTRKGETAEDMLSLVDAMYAVCQESFPHGIFAKPQRIAP